MHNAFKVCVTKQNSLGPHAYAFEGYETKGIQLILDITEKGGKYWGRKAPEGKLSQVKCTPKIIN